jgi:hypothetical protein
MNGRLQAFLSFAVFVTVMNTSLLNIASFPQIFELVRWE